jgi:hypothetical protein
MYESNHFANPPVKYKGTDFWMLNDALSDDEIDFQLSEMKAQGIASFIARTYIGLKSDYPGPGFKKHMRTIVECARKYGLKVFIQAGYMPEAVLDMPEEYALCNIKPMPVAEAADNGEILAELDGIAYVAVNTKTFLDMMNKDAIVFYLKQSYEDMWAEFQPDFGGVIESIWVDEPSYSQAGLPWSNTLVQAFLDKWGYDLKPKVPLLFLDRDDYQAVRCHYWLTVQELLRSAYFVQVHDWCKAHHILFSGHLMMEDTLSSQLARAGATMPYYKYFDIPGIDYLTAEMNWRCSPLKARSPGLSVNPGLYTTPLQCCSAARQAGQEQILAEMYGVSSENMTFRCQRNMFDHFASFGINHRSVHGIFYSLRGRGKRAYPPHVNYYQPYWNDYKQMTDYCGRVSYFISQGRPVREILVIHPLTSAACERRGPNSPEGQSPAIASRDADLLNLEWQLLAHQIGFDFGDEQTLEEWGAVIQSDDGKPLFKVGQMSYQAVVLPNLLTIAPSTWKLLKAFMAKGGKVFIYGKPPALLHGRPAPEIATSLSNADYSAEYGELVEKLLAIPREFDFTCTDDTTSILINYRRDEQYRYFFIFNSDCQAERTGVLTLNGNYLGTLLSGTGAPPCSVVRQTENGRTSMTFTIPAGSAVMLLVENALEAAALPAAIPSIAATSQLALPANWSLKRLHPNALVLEFAQYRKGDGDFSPVYPILAIHDILTKEDYVGPLTLRYVFHSAIAVKGAKLALESPKEQTVMLNGMAASSEPNGYYWDKSFETIDLPDISIGENVLEVSRFYRPLAKFKSSITSLFENLPGVELEQMVLIGDFGVFSQRMVTKGNGIRMSHLFTLNKEETSVQSELVDHGYPFYTGTMVLSQSFNVPRNVAGRDATLRLEGLSACLARVFLNGEYRGVIAWEPPELVIGPLKDGVNELRLELVNTIRNLIGPYHRPKGEYGEAWGGYGYPNLPWLGAVDENTRKVIPDWQDHRIPDTNAWTEDYMLVPFGLQNAFIFIHE